MKTETRKRAEQAGAWGVIFLAMSAFVLMHAEMLLGYLFACMAALCLMLGGMWLERSKWEGE